MARIEIAIKLIEQMAEKIKHLQETVEMQTALIERIEGLVDELDNRL
jgi:hypothetical protein